MRQTIRKHADFLMPEDARKYICDLFIARSRPTKWPGNAKYGLTATKRTFRHAVLRNRAKRLLRVWLRLNEHLLSPDLDYVFIARSAIQDTTLPIGLAQTARALEKLKAKG